MPFANVKMSYTPCTLSYAFQPPRSLGMPQVLKGVIQELYYYLSQDKHLIYTFPCSKNILFFGNYTIHSPPYTLYQNSSTHFNNTHKLLFLKILNSHLLFYTIEISPHSSNFQALSYFQMLYHNLHSQLHIVCSYTPSTSTFLHNASSPQ